MGVGGEMNFYFGICWWPIAGGCSSMWLLQGMAGGQLVRKHHQACGEMG